MIIDLGAYIGDYILYAATRGAYVIAVEPSSSNLSVLLQNISLNKAKTLRKVLISMLQFTDYRYHE